MQTKHLHLIADLVLIATFVIILDTYTNARDNLVLYLGLVILFVAAGINGFMSGINTAIDMFRKR